MAWYLRHDTEVERLRIAVGDYVQISADNLAEYEQVRQASALPADALERDGTEYAPQIVHSVVTGTPRRIVVNVPNDGLIDNLPDTVTVEVPATVDASGIRPEAAGRLPIACAAVNRPYASVVELTVAAGVTGDPRLVRQAAMADPNTAATLTLDATWRMCAELTAAHGELLPDSLHARVAP